MGVLRPPSDLRFWTVPMDNDNLGSTPMAHHYGISPSILLSFLYGFYGAACSSFLTAIIQLVMPDIFILLPYDKNRRKIYETVYHECAHASHYSQVGNTYWQKFVSRIIDNSILYALNPNVDSYGTGSEPDAGYIGVGEIWGNYFGARCMFQRFGDNGNFLSDYSWFKPGFLMDLHVQGNLYDQQLFGCFSSNINSIIKLRDELLWRFPDRTALINARYNYYYQ